MQLMKYCKIFVILNASFFPNFSNFFPIFFSVDPFFLTFV